MRDSVPTGRLTGSFVELHRAGCIQTGADVESDVLLSAGRFSLLFNALQHETGGNICNGCEAYSGGKCAAFRQYHSSQIKSRTVHPDSANQPERGPTVRQLATSLGVSISEVRRRKAAGSL